MLKTVTDAALFIEQIIGQVGGQIGTAGGPGGFDPAAAERVTEAFANLASIAIQAAHDAAGKDVTPESVQALMPVGTPLAPPVGE
jgi:uncharacterized membrane protein YdbT with pleckstrin-like domain